MKSLRPRSAGRPGTVHGFEAQEEMDLSYDQVLDDLDSLLTQEMNAGGVLPYKEKSEDFVELAARSLPASRVGTTSSPTEIAAHWWQKDKETIKEYEKLNQECSEVQRIFADFCKEAGDAFATPKIAKDGYFFTLPHSLFLTLGYTQADELLHLLGILTIDEEATAKAALGEAEGSLDFWLRPVGAQLLQTADKKAQEYVKAIFDHRLNCLKQGNEHFREQPLSEIIGTLEPLIEKGTLEASSNPDAAATKIQAIQRGAADRAAYQQKKQAKKETAAATHIQRMQRGKADREKVEAIKAATRGTTPTPATPTSPKGSGINNLLNASASGSGLKCLLNASDSVGMEYEYTAILKRTLEGAEKSKEGAEESKHEEEACVDGAEKSKDGAQESKHEEEACDSPKGSGLKCLLNASDSVGMEYEYTAILKRTLDGVEKSKDGAQESKHEEEACDSPKGAGLSVLLNASASIELESKAMASLMTAKAALSSGIARLATAHTKSPEDLPALEMFLSAAKKASLC